MWHPCNMDIIEHKTGYVKSETKLLGVEFTLKDGSKQFIPNNETLEEAAETYYLETKHRTPSCKKHFIQGAKWQEKRMYSREEVIELIRLSLLYSDQLTYFNMEFSIKENEFNDWITENLKQKKQDEK